jgi:hypothetical protein
MPDPQRLLRAEDLRARAEEVLARAETFRNADARQKLRRIAETYVKWRSGSNGHPNRPRVKSTGGSGAAQTGIRRGCHQ